MNSQKIIKGKLFLAVLVTMLCGMVAGGCSDDKDELEGKQYGYVQFKLYKSSSYTQEEKTRTDAVSTRASGLDKLIEATKALLSALTAGGWIAVMILIIVILFGGFL